MKRTIIAVSLLVIGGLLLSATSCKQSPQQTADQQIVQQQRQQDEAREKQIADRKAKQERAALAQAQKAEQERTAQVALQRYIVHRYDSRPEVIRGRRFTVKQMVSGNFMQDVLNSIPKQEYVDLVSMYKAIGGLDGTATTQALANCRDSFIGKYYVLQGDVFQIQADRDYPREGINEFSLFGNVNLVGDYYVPVNVYAISDEKIPPYTIAPILGKIIGFESGKNRADKAIIIPVVQVVLLISPSRCCGNPDEIIVGQPLVVAQLLRVNAQQVSEQQGRERNSVGEQEQTQPSDSLEASIRPDAEMSKKANADGLQLLKASNPDFEAAKRKFEEAVRSDPSNVEALNNLGYVYQRLGDFRTSEAHILKAIQLAPDRRVAYGNLGYVQAKLAKSSEASHNFCEYIKRFNDVEQGKATLKRVMSDPDVNVQSAVNEAIAQCSAR
jgi:tetratricopeptide (TPR) repeat protein